MIIKSSVLLVSKLNVLLSSSRFLHSEKKNETRKLFTCKVNYLNFYLTRVGVGGRGGRARGRQRSNATFQWAVNGRNTKGFLHLLLRSSTAVVLRHHEEDVDYEMILSSFCC